MQGMMADFLAKGTDCTYVISADLRNRGAQESGLWCALGMSTPLRPRWMTLLGRSPRLLSGRRHGLRVDCEGDSWTRKPVEVISYYHLSVWPGDEQLESDAEETCDLSCTVLRHTPMWDQGVRMTLCVRDP